MQKTFHLLTNLFPIWVLLFGALALVWPAPFVWFRGDWITWGLAVIMLGMGVTLSVDDFRAVLRMPRAVAAGFCAQYGIMPLLGWGIATALRLETPFAVGLILVGCCPGGTASNVVAYLARGDVALSVVMTTCSTLGAVVLTPALTAWLAGTMVPVDAAALFFSTVKVVLAPLALGVALHHLAPRVVRAVLPVAPLVSVAAITMICASIIGASAASLRRGGLWLLFGVALMHGCGFALGYLFARVLGYDRVRCRTISIEVGMQNSGLGAVLATNHFTDPLTALPCAISATAHSVIGSLLAGIWRARGGAPGDEACAERARPVV